MTLFIHAEIISTDFLALLLQVLCCSPSFLKFLFPQMTITFLYLIPPKCCNFPNVFNSISCFLWSSPDYFSAWFSAFSGAIFFFIHLFLSSLFPQHTTALASFSHSSFVCLASVCHSYPLMLEHSSFSYSHLQPTVNSCTMPWSHHKHLVLFILLEYLHPYLQCSPFSLGSFTIVITALNLQFPAADL